MSEFQATFFNILGETVPVFLIIGAGCLCRLVGLVTESSEKNIMTLALNVLYPCFIISKVCGNQSLQQVSVVATAFTAGLSLTVIALALSAGVSRLLKLKSGAERNTFTVSGAIQNYGFIPIPLIEGLFPADAKETLGVLFVHNLGLELALWTIGVVIISGTRAGMWRRLINGPTVAITVGLFLNFTSGYRLIPPVANDAMTQLGNCAIPVSLLLVGVSLAGVVLNDKWLSGWRIPVAAIVLRFLMMPVLFLLAAQLLSHTKPLMLILLVEAAMPAAVFPIVIAKHFGGKPAVAVEIVVFTTIASLALTPVILTFAIWLFGLSI